ncbi:MAG TPA: isoaspartyl peptidase/L-asparaginase [Thermoanaerobaculia bacterium]|nr:isoaspartyl peptidase/L-asparaginase [Thermoanaerobaculia bacterium]
MSRTIAERGEGRPKLVIHGGAGTISREGLTGELETQYLETLRSTLLHAFEILEKGGSSLDAVEGAVREMEDSPLFNAGRGSVFTHDGKVEMDASIMEGRTLKAGAVAGITIARNPVSAARAVMEKSPHVMLCGVGADDFARHMKLETAELNYFSSDRRWSELQEEIARESDDESTWSTSLSEGSRGKFGTVGAVAVDRAGNVAAATSTGGMTNKRYGRVGDSPIIGAGTYADNSSCAVSATGHGEYFLRYAVAHDVCALVSYKGLTVEQAAQLVIEKLRNVGGEGGVIAIDAAGHHSMAFNSEGMYRGWIVAERKPYVMIFDAVKKE